MNTPHKDINKIVPFGEFLRGFINQRYITVSDLLNVLRERGVFVFDHEKDVVVPVMQNLNLIKYDILFLKKRTTRKNFQEK